jgi:hypothetical protein
MARHADCSCGACMHTDLCQSCTALATPWSPAHPFFCHACRQYAHESRFGLSCTCAGPVLPALCWPGCHQNTLVHLAGLQSPMLQEESWFQACASQILAQGKEILPARYLQCACLPVCLLKGAVPRSTWVALVGGQVTQLSTQCSALLVDSDLECAG